MALVRSVNVTGVGGQALYTWADGDVAPRANADGRGWGDGEPYAAMAAMSGLPHYDAHRARYTYEAVTRKVASYAGQVVGRGSTYVGDGESTYYAEVWDGEKVTRVYAGDDRSWGWAIVADASDEVMAAAKAWKDAEAAARYATETARLAAQRAAQAEWEARQPGRGKRVVVTAKRAKVPYGAEGTVKATHDGQYGERVLVAWDGGGEDWTAARNVQVVQDELVAA